MAGAALGLVGAVLLVLQVARALAGNTLGTVATVLLWVGVGLLCIGAQLLTLETFWLNRRPSDSGQPADG
jgi:hypothetical protein